MILTLEEYRTLNPADKQTDSALELKLRALESAIRAWTNNNFQQRAFRFSCPVLNGKLYFTKTNSEHIQVINELQSNGNWYEY